VLNVWVGSVACDDATPVTSDQERGVRAYGWAHDDRHLFYIQDLNGDENWHLYTIDLATGAVVDRTPFDGAQARLAGRSRRRPHELLVEINADDRRFHDVYRLDLPSGSGDGIARGLDHTRSKSRHSPSLQHSQDRDACEHDAQTQRSSDGAAELGRRPSKGRAAADADEE